jgi:GxxExxY protein
MEATHDNALTGRVIGCAIEVHHYLGPGLLESIYETALCHELSQAGVGFVRQHPVQVNYKGYDIGCDFVLDLVSSNRWSWKSKPWRGFIQSMKRSC